jgi:predicted DsbA family dithiol-disulfide isomerase
MIENLLLPSYGTAVAIEIRDFPLPKHSWARDAAIVARFLETKDSRLAARFRRQMRKSIDAVNRNGLKYAISSFCRENRIDPAEVEAALIDPRYANAVDSDFRQGFESGIRQTPTVIVGDSKFIETIDLARLRSAIEAQLREAKRPRQGIGN